MNSKWRRGVDADGCGKPAELCTVLKGSAVKSEFSHGSPRLIHGLSTTLWKV